MVAKPLRRFVPRGVVLSPNRTADLFPATSYCRQTAPPICSPRRRIVAKPHRRFVPRGVVLSPNRSAGLSPPPPCQRRPDRQSGRVTSTIRTASLFDIDDTIAAIASPTSPALRGIVRLSGQKVADVLRRMRIEPTTTVPTTAARYDATLDLDSPLGSIPLAVMFWPTRRSYTGQPSAELHTYGAQPILDACLDAAIRSGARAARPGEFTMRAFLAGRLDLTQAEAVLGVIDAPNRGSLDHALRQLAGNLSRPLEQMRESILCLMADVEAGLDFVDEDIEFVRDEDLVERLSSLSVQLRETIKTMRSRGGGGGHKPVVVFRGLPNAGKSRLVNVLAECEAAIVADVQGTTRDVVHTDAAIGGRLVRLVDTAGIESARPAGLHFRTKPAARFPSRCRRRCHCLVC